MQLLYINYLWQIYTGGAGEGGGFLKACCNCYSYWYSRNQSDVPYRPFHKM